MSTTSRDFSNMIFKYGKGSVGTTLLPVWSAGTAYGGWNLKEGDGAVLSVVSTSALDKAGSGRATKIRLSGLDDNGLEISEEVTLNGLTPVLTTQLLTACFRAKVIEAETSSPTAGANAGNINISHTGAGTPLLAQIPALEGQTLMAMFKTPANKRGVWVEYDILPFANKETSMVVKMKENGSNVWQTQFSALADYRVQDDFGDTPRLIPPNSWIAVFAKATTGTSDVTAHLGILLEAVD